MSDSQTDDRPGQDGEPSTEVLPGGRARRFRQLSLFVGRQLLRVCPSAGRTDVCDVCHLRVLCKCAQEDFVAAAALEARVWLALSICGAVAILYTVWAFLRAS